MKREELEKMLPLLRPWLGRAGAGSLMLTCQLRACLALEGLEESGCGLSPWIEESLESLVSAALERAGEICDAGEAARLLYAAMDASFNSERLGERYVEQCRGLSERVIERFLEERRYAGDEEAERSVFRLIVLNLYGVGGPDSVHSYWRSFLDSLLERWSAESMGSVLWPGLSGEQRLRRHTAMLEEAYMLGDSRHAGLLERSYAELVCGAELASSGGGSLSSSSSVSFSGAESGGGTDFGYLSALYDAALDGTDGVMPDLALMDAVAERCDEFVLGSLAPAQPRDAVLAEVSGSDTAGIGIPAFAPSAGQAQALAVSVRHCCWQLSRQADEEFDRSF